VEEWARTLVDERLAACVNVVTGVRSFYRWKGKIEDSGEWLLVIKSSRGRFEELRAALEKLHSYDVPEVIALPVVFMVMLATFKGYDWGLNAAASTLGAGRSRILWRVTLPLVSGGLAVGFVTGFLQSFEELTVAMFVGGGLKTTLPKQMWDGILLQVNPIIAAASVVVLIVVILMFIVVEMIRALAARRQHAQ